MKTFTKQEILELYGQVTLGEISFSRMVEVINQRISESEVSEFKDGDFLHSDCSDENITIIFKNQSGDKIYYYASKSCFCGVSVNDNRYWRDEGDFRYATEAEKQELLDTLAKEGKRWNAEKLCIEDIPNRKFKKGDKVQIKEGVSSKTHMDISPVLLVHMDDLIGKELTVDRYVNGLVYIEESYYLHEEWLEPYEELKKGDLAIFWDEDERYAAIRIYDRLNESEGYFRYKDKMGDVWANAIKFESKEQYERLIKGEI